MSGKICVLLIFAVFTNIVNSKDEEWVITDTVERNAGNLKIRLIRATSTRLYVQALCEPSCEGIKWESLSYRFGWAADSHPMTVEDQGYGRYRLGGLSPLYEYIVEARLGGSFDRLRARTCGGHVDHLEELTTRFNGPGWLDIRWKPPNSYECKEDIEYVTRYGVDGSFSQNVTYGAYPIDERGNLHIGPSHPCDDWPKHFCLLITENVKAGKNHTVEITPRRIGGGSIDVGKTQSIVAFADPYNTQGALESGVHPQCQLWMWLGVGASLFCIAVIIGVLVSALVTTYEKTQLQREEEMNAENDGNGENEGNEETEETALTTESAESRQSEEISENAHSEDSQVKKWI